MKTDVFVVFCFSQVWCLHRVLHPWDTSSPTGGALSSYHGVMYNTYVHDNQKEYFTRSVNGVFLHSACLPGRNVSTGLQRTFWAGRWILLSLSPSVMLSVCWGRSVHVTPVIISSPLWDNTWPVCLSMWRLARCWSMELSWAAWSR